MSSQGAAAPQQPQMLMQQQPQMMQPQMMQQQPMMQTQMMQPQQQMMQQMPGMSFGGLGQMQQSHMVQQQQQLMNMQGASSDIAAALARVQALSATLPVSSQCNKVIRELYIGGLPPGVPVSAQQVGARICLLVICEH
jgi:hypothetical protein